MLLVLSVMALHMAATSTATAGKNIRAEQARKHQVIWIHKWTQADKSIYPAINKAAWIFRVDSGLLRTIVGREGGNVNPAKLHRSLCNGSQPGWNLSGSYAFGPFQFMLDNKPACNSGWGTFSSYVYAAFRSARQLGHPVPRRFEHPASNVGQAITAAYMIAHGGLHHWCASMC